MNVGHDHNSQYWYLCFKTGSAVQWIVYTIVNIETLVIKMSANYQLIWMRHPALYTAANAYSQETLAARMKRSSPCDSDK